MADNDKHKEDKKDDSTEENVAAVVPFLLLNEAGAYIDDILAVLEKDSRFFETRVMAQPVPDIR